MGALHLSNKNEMSFILYCIRFALSLHHTNENQKNINIGNGRKRYKGNDALNTTR